MTSLRIRPFFPSTGWGGHKMRAGGCLDWIATHMILLLLLLGTPSLELVITVFAPPDESNQRTITLHGHPGPSAPAFMRNSECPWNRVLHEARERQAKARSYLWHESRGLKCLQVKVFCFSTFNNASALRNPRLLHINRLRYRRSTQQSFPVHQAILRHGQDTGSGPRER